MNGISFVNLIHLKGFSLGRNPCVDDKSIGPNKMGNVYEQITKMCGFDESVSATSSMDATAKTMIVFGICGSAIACIIIALILYLKLCCKIAMNQATVNPTTIIEVKEVSH
jgi:hypothetical protein